MKKLIALALTLVMAVAMFVPAAADDSDIIFKGTPVVDGVLDSIYEGSATYTVEDVHPGFYGKGPANGDTYAVTHFLWDENYVYVCTVVQDKDIVITDAALRGSEWETDGIEIIFDNESKWRLMSQLDGTFVVWDGETPFDFNKCINKVTVGDNTYTIEIAIPMNNLSVDFEFGFSLQVDNFGTTNPTECFYACGSGDAEMYYTCSSTEVKAPETTADTTPVTEPTPSVTPSTPATFDAGIIAAVAAIVSAAGYMLAKKK